MSASSPMALALVAEVAGDPDALAQLADALRPFLDERDADTGDTLTSTRAAARAEVHPRTITRAADAGTLRAHKRAGRWHVEPDDLAAWIDAGCPTSTIPTHRNGRTNRTATATAGADAIAGITRAA